MCLTRMRAFCANACVVCLLCKGSQPAAGEHQPWGHQWNAGVRKKPLLCSRINRRRALPTLITVVFYSKSKNTGHPALRLFLRLQPSCLKDVWSFSTSQSPLKPGPEQRWIHTRKRFRFLLKFLVIATNHLIQQHHFTGFFKNRGIASALKSLQPTWDRQSKSGKVGWAEY